MIRDITIGQYYPAKSVIHKLDPRTKLFGTLVFISNDDDRSQRLKQGGVVGAAF